MRVDDDDALVYTRTPTRGAAAARAIVWVYLAFVLTVVAGIYGFGDVTWWGTILLFSPRWLWGLPIPIVLVVGFAWGSWWTRLAGVAATAVWAGWIWSFVVPWQQFTTRAEGVPIRVMTCNVAGERLHAPSLERLLRDVDPDIAVFQEADKELEQSLPENWRIVRAGEIVLCARAPIQARFDDLQWYGMRFLAPICGVATVELEGGPVMIASVHFHTPRDGLMQVLDRRTVIAPSRKGRLEHLMQLRENQQRRVRSKLMDAPFTGPLVIAGDFNTPVESVLYRSVWGDLHNAFSESGWGPGQTIRVSVRSLSFGARIDHILHDDTLRSAQTWIGPSIGSDHRPVIADLYRN